MKEIIRNPEKPILTKDDLTPSLEEFEIAGVFNPGACKFKNEYLLLVRVAEVCQQENGWFKIPMMDFSGDKPRLAIKSWKTSEIDLTDPRKLWVGAHLYLSSISHLRLARSKDGVNFKFDPKPFISAGLPDEAYGVEDPRITKIENSYYITYTAVSGDSYGVSLASTNDFKSVQRQGMILPPQNKDTCLFPEKINGKYIALHRPISDHFTPPSIWYSESPDLLHWGNHACIMRPNDNQYENEKIGIGPEPIKTPEGWLILYHGVGNDSVYSLHLGLLDLNDPRKILKRTAFPVMVPEEPWEKQGFFPNVVFSNGWILEPDGRVLIYYGAADESIGVAETTLDDLLKCFDRGASV